MLEKRLAVFGLAAATIGGLATPHLAAQYAPAPDTYSVTQLNLLMGTAMIQRIWRDGSKAMIDTAEAISPRTTDRVTNISINVD